jgi:translation initiation factor IF-2
VSEPSGPQSTSNLREQGPLGSRSPSSLFRPLSSRFRPPGETQPRSEPTRNWASSISTPSQAFSGPQRLRVSPSPNSLSKWARTSPPSPPPSVVSSTQPSSSSHPFGQRTVQLTELKRQSAPHRASLEQASGRLQGNHSRRHPNIQGTKTFNSKNLRLSQERLARPTDQLGPGSKRDSQSLGFSDYTPEGSRPSKDQFCHARLSRNAFKERGSMVLNLESNTFTPSRSRETLSRKSPSVQKTRLNFAAERGPVDVYIPSTVSVGTLARLLKIKLCKQSYVVTMLLRGSFLPFLSTAAAQDAQVRVG